MTFRFPDFCRFQPRSQVTHTSVKGISRALWHSRFLQNSIRRRAVCRAVSLFSVVRRAKRETRTRARALPLQKSEEKERLLAV